jgi:hypothetical protein
MSFFGSGVFYGSGSFYVGAFSAPADGIPQNLTFYRTSQDGVYVFWFGFLPSFITPSLASANFDLELDTVNTFNSPNLVTFSSGSLVNPPITFQNGNVVKGFAVPVAARQEGIVQTWYARVRTHTPSYISDWSSTLTWTIPQKVQQKYAEALMNSLPDYHVYGKGDLLKPLNQRNTNLWLVEDMYGNQLDQVYYANFLTQTDNYITLCVDENLYQNFGVLFNFPKPNTMQFVDYRWILMNLIAASLVGSTNEAIILTIQSFTGVPPEITPIRDENDFFLNTIQDPPTTQQLNSTTITSVIDSTHLKVASIEGWVPGAALDVTTSVPFTVTDVIDDVTNGTQLVVSSTAGMAPGNTLNQSVFFTSQPFIDASLVVEDITTGLLISNTPTAQYVTDGARSNFTLILPTTPPVMKTDILQATFGVGNPNDPFPVIFDALAGSTALTGLVTFTNGSTALSGSGTLFLTELTVGEEITDPHGIYLGEISGIADNTHATLLNPWAGPTEVVTAYRLLYTDLQVPPPILWDKSTLAWGVLITIFNPGHFALN